MKITGIICEYNPLHLGHKKQMDIIRGADPDGIIVCLMSGNYVQRGKPAIVDKSLRAKAAVMAGADLGLELPVLSDWDYTKLNIAPCRYHGTLRGEDLVIMAHNYSCHFGPISRLQEGDEVLFVDMDGILTRYQVVGSDILNPFSSREITAGVYDLTLFTCTYGGKSRVTVYCNREK